MPNGEFSPVRKMLRVLATPSPLASRSSVMRFALGWAGPAPFLECLSNPPPMSRFGARLAGAGPFLELLGNPSAYAELGVRLGRRVAFGDQHVAVRQHIDRARMRKI